MIRLSPGCVCQPVLPPGCQTLLCTYRSDHPFGFCQTGGMLLLWPSSISAKRPTASVVAANPCAGVARSFPAWSAVTTIRALDNSNHVNFWRITRPLSHPSVPFFSRESRQDDYLTHHA